MELFNFPWLLPPALHRGCHAKKQRQSNKRRFPGPYLSVVSRHPQHWIFLFISRGFIFITHLLASDPMPEPSTKVTMRFFWLLIVLLIELDNQPSFGIVQIDPQIPMTEKSLTMTIVANRLTGEAIATAADCKGTDDVLGVTCSGTIDGACAANGTSTLSKIENNGRLLAIRYCILDGL